MIFVRINEDEREEEALRQVVEYLKEEERDYEGQGRPGGHIWESVRVLAAWLTEIGENLQVLGCQMQISAKRFRNEGVPREEWPKELTVGNARGDIRLIWIEEKKRKCSGCKHIEFLLPCDHCGREFCDYCLRFFTLTDETEPYLCPECCEKPIYD